MLVIISSRMHDRVKDAWNGQILRIDHEEDSNKVWQLSHLPMTNDVYMFAPSKIPRQILDQLLPLYVSLDDEEYMNVSGVKVKTDIKIRGFNSKKEVVDWYTIHDMLVERSDLRKASGDMVRQFCFGLDLPMNGSEIETINMKNTHGFRNIVRGIRKPFWNIHALNGSKFINIEIDELGIDSLKETEKKDLGQKKLEVLLDSTYEFDDYLIYVGSAPGHSINTVLRRSKSVKYAHLIDPRETFVDPRKYGESEVTIKVTRDYATPAMMYSIIDNWKKEFSNKTKRMFFFSDIRVEKEESDDLATWDKKVKENEILQKELLDVFIDSGEPFKYMLKVRIPWDESEDYRMLSDDSYLFPAPFSRDDLFELREYCARFRNPKMTLVKHDEMIDLKDSILLKDFSLRQKLGIFSLQIEDCNTQHDYRPSVDIFYLTDPKNKWNYETFYLKASSSAVASWWTSVKEPYEYGDRMIPQCWLTRICEENEDISVIRGDQFSQICRRKLNQMNKSIGVEWQSEFHYTLNLHLWKKTDETFSNQIKYSIDAYYSQSRGIRQELNIYKRFDSKYTKMFNEMKAYCNKVKKIDLSGHLRMMCLGGSVSAVDIPRWLRQVYSSIVMNDSSDKYNWIGVSEYDARRAQKGAIAYESKGANQVWHTREDLLWTIATMCVLRDKCVDKHAIYIPNNLSMRMLNLTSEMVNEAMNELVQVFA